VGVPVRVRVSHKWIPGIVQSVCPEPNSYVVLTDCGRLFRRNRQAINVDKFRCRQLLQQEPVVCLRSTPAEAANPVPIRKSLNFLEEWQSALRILSQPPPSHPTAVVIGVAETDDPEDFMEAFHGFEELELNHQPERRRGRPKTWSTHHSRKSSARPLISLAIGRSSSSAGNSFGSILWCIFSMIIYHRLYCSNNQHCLVSNNCLWKLSQILCC
jgi:hypothetical protein